MAIAGDDAGGAPGSAVHAYLPLLAAVIAVVAVGAAGHFARSMARARRGIVEPGPAGLAPLWAQATTSILAIHILQELIEGHLAGAGAGPFAGFGLVVAAPVAAGAGLIVAFLLRSAHVVLVRMARQGVARPIDWRAPARFFCASSALPRRAPLACHLAGRAPPLTV